MAIKKDTLDQLLDGRDPKVVFNKDGLFDELKKALVENIARQFVGGIFVGNVVVGHIPAKQRWNFNFIDRNNFPC